MIHWVFDKIASHILILTIRLVAGYWCQVFKAGYRYRWDLSYQALESPLIFPVAWLSLHLYIRCLILNIPTVQVWSQSNTPYWIHKFYCPPNRHRVPPSWQWDRIFLLWAWKGSCFEYQRFSFQESTFCRSRQRFFLKIWHMHQC